MKKCNHTILNLICGLAFSFMFLSVVASCEDSGNGDVDNEAFLALKATVDDNSDDISTNTEDISTNAAAVSTHAASIAANTANISTNAANIGTNSSSIADHAADISANAMGISENSAAISANANDIAANATAILDHDQSITGHQDRLVKAFGFVNHTELNSVYGTENVNSVVWNDGDNRYEVTLANQPWTLYRHCAMQVTPYGPYARYAAASLDGSGQPVLYVFLHDVGGNRIQGSFHWTLHCY